MHYKINDGGMGKTQYSKLNSCQCPTINDHHGEIILGRSSEMPAFLSFLSAGIASFIFCGPRGIQCLQKYLVGDLENQEKSQI